MKLVDYMRDFIYYWLLVFVYAGLIFYFSSLPTIPPLILKIIPETFILHMIEYAILTILLFRALTNSKNSSLNNTIFLSITIAVLYGVTDEIHQHFVPGRTFSVLDVFGNSIGSMLGIIINLKFYNKIRQIA